MPRVVLSEEEPVLAKGNSVQPLFTDLVADRSAVANVARFNQHLASAIEEADKFIFVEIYGFERADIVDHLVAKAAAGVKVFLTVDPAEDDDEYEEAKAETLKRLYHRIASEPAAQQNFQIGFLPLLAEQSDQSGRVTRFAQIDHHKVFVADDGRGGLVEISGGINYGTHSNQNYDVAVRIAGPAALIQLRFLLKLHESALGPDGRALRVDETTRRWIVSATPVPVVASVDVTIGRTARVSVVDGGEEKEVVTSSYEQVVRQTLAGAQEEILIACFAFTDIEFMKTDNFIAETLRERKESGVSVRVVVDALTIDGRAINESTVYRLVRYGLDVRYYEPISAGDYIPESKNQTKLHSKLAIVDGKSVLVGSANWSNNGFRFNMEAGKRIDSESCAREVRSVFFKELWKVSKSVSVPELMPFAERRLLLSAQPNLDAPLLDPETTYVTFDLETTGFATWTDRIIQIAAVAGNYDLVSGKAQDGWFNEIAVFDELVNPGTGLGGTDLEIPPDVVELTGILPSDLADRDTIDVVLRRLVAWLSNLPRPIVLVGHNVGFDYRLLQASLLRVDAGGWVIDQALVDTLSLSRNAVYVEPEFSARGSHQLQQVMRRLDLPLPDENEWHDAKTDVRATAKVLGGLVQLGQKRGLKLRKLSDLDAFDAFVQPSPASLDAIPVLLERPSPFETNLVNELLESSEELRRLEYRAKAVHRALLVSEELIKSSILVENPEANDTSEFTIRDGGEEIRVIATGYEWTTGGEDLAQRVFDEFSELDSFLNPAKPSISLLDRLRPLNRQRWAELSSTFVELREADAPSVKLRPRSRRWEMEADEALWLSTLFATDEIAIHTTISIYKLLSRRELELSGAIRSLDTSRFEKAKNDLIAYREGAGEDLRIWNDTGDSALVSRSKFRRLKAERSEHLLNMLAESGVSVNEPVTVDAVLEVVKARPSVIAEIVDELGSAIRPRLRLDAL